MMTVEAEGSQIDASETSSAWVKFLLGKPCEFSSLGPQQNYFSIEKDDMA
jgi:hypothetical protein